MVAPWVIPTAVVGAASIGSSLFGKKKSSVSQVPMEPPEVTLARQKLLEFARTGALGNYTAGEGYGGELGDFEMGGLESEGQSRLMSMIKGGNPEIFNSGKNELHKILTTDLYDPYSENGLFKGFKYNLERENKDRADSLKRNAAFSGNLYSSNTARRLGDLEEQTANQSSSKLAELYDTFVQRRMSAAGQAVNAGTAEEAINQGRIDQTQRYGGLARTLNDTRIQRQMQDFLRKRQEQGQQVGALQSVAGSAPQYGVPNLSIPQSSPWENVLAQAGNIGGNALAQYLALKKYIPKDGN